MHKKKNNTSSNVNGKSIWYFELIYNQYESIFYHNKQKWWSSS